MSRRPRTSSLFPYTTLFRSPNGAKFLFVADRARSEKVGDYKRCFELFDGRDDTAVADSREDRKSTRLNSSHLVISYAVFCLKKKKEPIDQTGQAKREQPTMF